MLTPTLENIPPVSEKLTRTVEEVTCYQLVFRKGDKIIGRVQLHASNDHSLEVVDLFVEPEDRGNGHARRILDELVSFARDHGARELIAHAAPANTLAYSAFIQMGFRACDDEVHLARGIGETNSEHSADEL